MLLKRIASMTFRGDIAWARTCETNWYIAMLKLKSNSHVRRREREDMVGKKKEGGNGR